MSKFRKNIMRKKRDLVLLIHAFCQMKREPDLSFISRRKLRSLSFLELVKIEQSIKNGNVPKLLFIILREYQFKQKNKLAERQLVESFAFEVR